MSVAVQWPDITRQYDMTDLGQPAPVLGVDLPGQATADDQGVDQLTGGLPADIQ
jgi:hypothetical protein